MEYRLNSIHVSIGKCVVPLYSSKVLFLFPAAQQPFWLDFFFVFRYIDGVYLGKSILELGASRFFLLSFVERLDCIRQRKLKEHPDVKKKTFWGRRRSKEEEKKKLSRVTLHVYVLWDRLPIRPLYSIKPTFYFSFHQPEILNFFCIRFFRKKAVDTGFFFLLIRPSVRSGLSRRVLVVLGEASCNSSSSSNLFERKCMSSSRWQLSHRGECSFVGFALRE